VRFQGFGYGWHVCFLYSSVSSYIDATT
jgi:hypothetical protein